MLSSGDSVTYSELSDCEMSRCGAAFCPAQLADSDTPATSNKNFQTDITKIYIIAGIYLACSIMAAFIIAFFVDPLTR